MAGVYTQNDTQRGVWNAPANVGLMSVTGATVKITDKMQHDLNVTVDGLAINAIREFTGRGTLVWGARTLDGNSNDWRYIQVRRTLIYIEQSVQLALAQVRVRAERLADLGDVTAMITSFLRDVWEAGGLAGDSPRTRSRSVRPRQHHDGAGCPRRADDRRDSAGDGAPGGVHPAQVPAADAGRRLSPLVLGSAINRRFPDAHDSGGSRHDRAPDGANAAPAKKVERTAKSLECSKQADTKNLHGKPRKVFMRTCKKA